MTAYRIASRKYPAGNSEGAKRSGGRWNPKGVAVIYASRTASLVASEVIAHRGAIPDDFAVIRITVPDHLPTLEINPALQLGADWKHRQDLTTTAGAAWVESAETAVLIVPSAVWENEYNVLLNPAHPDFSQI
jgi:RES domain-containing protein